MTLNKVRFFFEIIMTGAEKMQESKWSAMQKDLQMIAHFDSEKKVWFVDETQKDVAMMIYRKHYGFTNEDQLNLF